MTGRRLYDLYCDAWKSIGNDWVRESSSNRLGVTPVPPAWPFLSGPEQTTFNRIAARLKGVKR